jgi:hypothetical protein
VSFLPHQRTSDVLPAPVVIVHVGHIHGPVGGRENASHTRCLLCKVSVYPHRAAQLEPLLYGEARQSSMTWSTHGTMGPRGIAKIPGVRTSRSLMIGMDIVEHWASGQEPRRWAVGRTPREPIRAFIHDVLRKHMVLT